MERKIKFRAWDKLKEEMGVVAGIEFTERGDTDVHIRLKDPVMKTYRVSRLNPTLMQFTGLTDKNGREIYEGDHVKIDDETYVVIYDTRGFSFFTLDLNGYYGHDLTTPQPEDMEVVGNTFENKELLDQPQQ